MSRRNHLPAARWFAVAAAGYVAGRTRPLATARRRAWIRFTLAERGNRERDALLVMLTDPVLGVKAAWLHITGQSRRPAPDRLPAPPLAAAWRPADASHKPATTERKQS